MALATLYSVLLTACKVMSPFTPFLTEAMYQNLKGCLPAAAAAPESVHFCDIPEPREVRSSWLVGVGRRLCGWRWWGGHRVGCALSVSRWQW